MRVSQLFGATLRAAPSDELFSHQLLLRAGYLQQLAAGIFSLLPLGARSQERIRRILREEMNAIGGQEVAMPVVQPADIWQRSGRWQDVDETLVRFQDRRGREMVVAMTHEEVVADLAASQVSSYRDLPRIVYQIQTKFRDEPRPRAGLIRTREFWMKDSYSLDRDPEGLLAAYRKHFHAYFRIAARAGLPVAAVLSDVGMMGGKVAHEFMYLSDQGEDTLLLCPRCGYAANQEVAERLEAPAEDIPELPLEEVATPGCTTVAEVAAALGVELSRVAKTVGYLAELERGRGGRVVLAVVPGDREVNLARLRQASGAVELRAATAEELAQVGAVAGYMSPRGLDRAAVTVIADSSLRRRRNLVAGANREGWHLRNFNLERDGQVDQELPLAAAVGGDPCPRCAGPLDLRRGIEYGNIFQLGTRYSEALGAMYTDEDGRQRPVVMGSYGIGLGRLLACVAEEHHDERGLALPVSIAPFQVALVQVGADPKVVEAAQRLYHDLERAGVEALYDDRDVSAGIKFADSDLRGMPLRVTVSPRTLQREAVELKRRLGEARDVPLAGAAGAVQEEVGALWQELDLQVSERMARVEELAERTFGPAG